jgi:hypothetical protein
VSGAGDKRRSTVPDTPTEFDVGQQNPTWVEPFEESEDETTDPSKPRKKSTMPDQVPETATELLTSVHEPPKARFPSDKGTVAMGARVPENPTELAVDLLLPSPEPKLAAPKIDPALLLPKPVPPLSIRPSTEQRRADLDVRPPSNPPPRTVLPPPPPLRSFIYEVSPSIVERAVSIPIPDPPRVIEPKKSGFGMLFAGVLIGMATALVAASVFDLGSIPDRAISFFFGP